MPLIGTETEYGIAAPAEPGLDPVLLSELVVASYDGPATPVLEGVHNRVLGNGARLYVDHGHPEYSAPETTCPSDALLWELAGDALVQRAAAAASERVGTPVHVFKNNTDGKGASYGYHENYLLRRSTPWVAVSAALPAFLVSRIVLTGAGRVGLGPASEASGFQLSQRADFFERVEGLDTTRRRGIVNTRDEPHARWSQWRRLHVIAGDATRSPFATWLRLGSAALALAALEAGLLPVVRLADPVAALRSVSRDLTASRPVALADGGSETAVGLQQRYLDACRDVVAREGFPEGSEVLAAWQGVLDDLRGDPARTADRLDWAAKLALLEAYRTRHGAGWDDPRVAALDLRWADLEPAGSVVGALQGAGRLPAGPSREAVSAAEARPPADTRAHTRGHLVADHPDAVVVATWDSVLLRDARGRLHTVAMPDPLGWGAADFDASAPLARLLATNERGGTR